MGYVQDMVLSILGIAAGQLVTKLFHLDESKKQTRLLQQLVDAQSKTSIHHDL